MSKNIILSAFCFMSFTVAKAQLGFCTGVSGEPIFSENFGAGIANGPALPLGVTSYTYIDSGTQDGQYSISRNAGQLGDWWQTGDHTGNANGKMLIVNASFNPGMFYRTPISGLCENTPYEFSAWILNVLRGNNNSCTGIEVPIQVRFEIWDATDTNLLASGAMAPRFADTFVNWVQYGLTFTTTAGQNGVVLKMINQGRGGCGNDLAIDDIAFRTCGDATSVATSSGMASFLQCANEPAQTFTLNANATVSVFSTPVYQWQSSTDGVTFMDITGAINTTFTTGLLTTDIFFRVKVAEDAINLTNPQCVNFSDIWAFELVTVLAPVALSTTVVACDSAAAMLEVTVNAGETAAWFSSPTGGTVLATGTRFTATASGIYYAEAINAQSNCRSTSRTEITFTQDAVPQVTSEDYDICPETGVVLDTEFIGGTYLWNTGETTQVIIASAAGNYLCTVTNSAGCESIATFNVLLIEPPIISSIDVVGDELTITLANTGDFRYSIDGFNYQASAVFNINGLLEITVRVRNVEDCNPVRQQFVRIAIPAFFTPNNDGFNDRWEIYGIAEFPGAHIEIYDRHGKLLAFINEAVTGWDGLYNNQPMPSSDYWYRLLYNNQMLSGHFTLKR
jgi:gliding motility-associated-like protein